MENPYAPPNRRKKDEPQSKNHFQRELEEKLRQKGYKESDSEDELGSDDELMHGFNMTSKGKPKWTPPSANKKPLSERNAQKTPSPNRTSPNRTSKAEIIFGKKGVEISDSDESEDEENSPSNGLMKTMKPWQSPSQLARKSKEKDDVDADVSHYSRYDNSRLGGTLKESSSLAKHRPKSPKSNSNLDLDAIKEEREPEPASRPKPQPRATKTDPKLRSKSPAEQKSRGSTPTTDLFGSKSSKRDISPKTPEKKCSANDDDESKRRSSILDMLGASNVSAPKDSKRPSDKTKPSKQGEKKKLLLDEDSDDSIGAEYGRPGPSPYAKHGDRKSPKHPFDDRRSPYDKDRRSPYDKDRRSPYDKDRRSPYDIGPPSTSTMDRARLGHIRGPLDDDYERKGRRKRTDHTGATMNPFKDSIYEESNKKKNPFAKDKDEDRHRDDRRSPYDKDRHRDDRRSPYGKDRHNDDGRSPYDKHHRDDEKTDRKKNPFAKDKDDRKSPYDERYTDDRRSPFEKEHRDDEKTDRKKNPFAKDKDDRKSPYDERYTDDRRSPFEKQHRDDHRSPYDKDRRNPFDKHRSPDRYDQYERTGKDRAMKNTRFEDDEEEWQRHKREQEERSRSKSRRPKEERGEERESSLCRDVDKDPSSMRRAEPDVDSKRKTQTRRSHTTENKILDQVIDAVDKEQSSFKPIDPANKQTDKTDENKQKQRSQSARRPKPRYAKPVVESFPTARPATADFNNTCDIRDLVYREWYEKRTKLANEERQKKLQQEKEEQEKNKKAEEEKKMEAELSYKSWLETKKEKDPEKYKEKKKEIMKEEEKKKEQEDKKTQAAKNYKYWKENKDIKIREEQRKKKEEEEEKKREEERKVREKEKDAESAKREWERQKAIQLDKEARQKRKEEAQKKREEERKQRERDEEARKKYDEWMRKKEMDENKHKKTTKTRHLEEIDNPRPAWSPANRTIPFGR